MQYVSVAVNLPVKNIFKQFMYAVPDSVGELSPGWRVVVPFGVQKLEGFVVELYDEKTAAEIFPLKNVKPLIARLGKEPWFTEEMLATAKWLADYYLCSLAESMRLFIPGKSSIKKHAVYDENGKLKAYEYEQVLKPKMRVAYVLSKKGMALSKAGDASSKKNAVSKEKILSKAEEMDISLPEKQLEALHYLKEKGEAVTLKEAEEAGISTYALQALQKKGLAFKTKKRVLRNSYDEIPERQETLNLTDEQLLAVKEIFADIEANRSGKFLLQGITGSGKTEVYLRATEKALKEGRQVLVLVPEIALTTQIVSRFQEWFKDTVAVVHSKLSQNERGDAFQRMRTGDAGILIGVRSAVFAPFKNLGLVIIDEEQESSYKQEGRPSYHAGRVAEKRCKSCNAVLLLGSATPSLESYLKAQMGEIRHLRLTKRPSGAVLPQVEVVDMRKELEARNFSVLSRSLRRAIIATVHQGEQGIILLNRRGYSTFVMCRDCGVTLMCPHCAVSLVYHATENLMRCHYCGESHPIPTVCPECGSKRIKFFGTGTQKAQASIAELPDVTVLRMDQDSTANKMAHEDIIRAFAEKKANILLGTQMVAKGHDIENVTLVGVLAADSSLNIPDFRASERCFDLLTQAAGRAGRGGKKGHVVLQTYEPESRIIQLAARQDYDTFAAEELKQRKELNYPPYGSMIKLTISGKDEEKALQLADETANYLKEAARNEKWKRTEIMGPIPAAIAKISDIYRMTVLIKTSDPEKAKAALWRSGFKDEGNVVADVDPLNTM